MGEGVPCGVPHNVARVCFDCMPQKSDWQCMFTGCDCLEAAVFTLSLLCCSVYLSLSLPFCLCLFLCISLCHYLFVSPSPCPPVTLFLPVSPPALPTHVSTWLGSPGLATACCTETLKMLRSRCCHSLSAWAGAVCVHGVSGPCNTAVVHAISATTRSKRSIAS